MKLSKYLFYIIAGAMGLTSCSSSDSDEPSGMGSVSISADFGVSARSMSHDELLSGCELNITNTRGIVKRFKSINDVPEKVWLESGSYQLSGIAGDSVAASFDKCFYKGVVPFSVGAGTNTSVTLEMKLANVLASVYYDDKLKGEIKDYSVKVAHSGGALTYIGDDSRVGYFMMPNGDEKDLNWELTATAKDGRSITKRGVIRDVKSANEYKIKFSYSGELPSIGTIDLELAIDASIEVINQDITINSAPEITLDGLDIDATQVYEKGASRRHAVIVKAAAGLKDVKLQSADFALLGIDEITQFEVYQPSQATVATLYSKGINMVEQENADGSSVMVINFSEKLCNLLPVNDYTFDIIATDREDNITRSTLRISITEPSVK